MRSIRVISTGLVVIGLVLASAPAAAAQEPSKPGVVRENVWHLRDTLTSGPATTQFRYGATGDFPIGSCDWNGDGAHTPAVQRPDHHNIFWLPRASNSSGPADAAFRYGRSSDVPVCGDWNGNGQQTPGIVRQRGDNRLEWHLRNANSGGAADITFIYGREIAPQEARSTIPVVGDWNGDGIDTPGVVMQRRDRRFEWHLRNAHRGGAADTSFVYYGGAVYGDHLEVHNPVVGDWNGDGIDTAGVIRGSGGNYRWLLRDEHAGGPADRSFHYGRHLDWVVIWK